MPSPWSLGPTLSLCYKHRMPGLGLLCLPWVSCPSQALLGLSLAVMSGQTGCCRILVAQTSGADRPLPGSLVGESPCPRVCSFLTSSVIGILPATGLSPRKCICWKS